MQTLDELLAKTRVRGLCSYDYGGPVTVRDASTGEVKRVIYNVPGFDEIINVPGNITRRINLKRHGKNGGK